jgi:hypothetical protein
MEKNQLQQEKKLLEQRMTTSLQSFQASLLTFLYFKFYVYLFTYFFAGRMRSQNDGIGNLPYFG